VRTIADLFKALSDETRLRMVALMLRHGELCVCDFMEALQVTQSKASRHLRALVHAGLASNRRDAVWVLYRIRDRMAPEAAALLEALRPLLAACDLHDADARLEAWDRSGGRYRLCRGQAQVGESEVADE